MEIWKPVVNYEGLYEVSSLGNVKSFVRYPEGRLLKPGIGSHGYPTVVLYSPSRKRGLTHTVHSLVLNAFVGPKPDNCEACHNDGNRANASLSNLRWGTRSENQRDKYLHNTSFHGERGPHAKLKNEDVACIRHLLKRKITHKTIADLFGVSKTTITEISLGKTWNMAPVSEYRSLEECIPHDSDMEYKPRVKFKTVH